MPREKGKFWPKVRAMIWEKAQELFQQDEARTMEDDFKGTTAEKSELWEAGYFYTAKLIVLRNLWLQKKDLPPIEIEGQQDLSEELDHKEGHDVQA